MNHFIIFIRFSVLKLAQVDFRHAAMKTSAPKRKLDETETSRKKPRIEVNSEPDSAKDLAERIGKEDELAAGVCKDYVKSRWDKLLPWARSLCAHGDAARDELLYWEGYKHKEEESPQEQFSRQIRQDFQNLYAQLVEEGCSEDEAAVVTSSETAESLCDLVLTLLDLIQNGASKGSAEENAERRFFALRIDINQEGSMKFHHDCSTTSMRIQVPLHGPGPSLVLPDKVNWDFWDSESGLMPQENEALEQGGEEVTIEVSAIRDWNQKLCGADVSLNTSEGSLIMLKGGEDERPVLQRFAYPDEEETKLLLTLDYVTEAVKDQILKCGFAPKINLENINFVHVFYPIFGQTLALSENQEISHSACLRLL